MTPPQQQPRRLQETSPRTTEELTGFVFCARVFVPEVFPRRHQAAVVDRPALLLQRRHGSQLHRSPRKPGPPRHVLTHSASNSLRSEKGVTDEF